MGQLFWLSPKWHDFRGFRHAKTPKITEFLKNRPIFEGKSLKMGTFLVKIILKDGYGFWGSCGTPRTPLSNSNLSTPLGLYWYFYFQIDVICMISSGRVLRFGLDGGMPLEPPFFTNFVMTKTPKFGLSQRIGPMFKDYLVKKWTHV